MRHQSVASRERRGTPVGALVSFVWPLIAVMVSVATAFLTGGCHNNYEMPPQEPPADVPNPRLRVTLQMAPAKARQMDPMTFTFRLSDAHRRAVDDAKMTAELVMPAMEMGTNEVVAQPQGQGVYVGTGRFSMSGDWRVIVTASKGPQRSVMTFPVRVR